MITDIFLLLKVTIFYNSKSKITAKDATLCKHIFNFQPIDTGLVIHRPTRNYVHFGKHIVKLKIIQYTKQ